MARRLTINPGRRAAQARQNLADQAMALHRAGRLDDAIRLYWEALRRDPDQPRVLNNLGVALRASKRPRAAVAVYLEALRLDEANAGAWSNFGNAFRDLGRFDDAIRCHREAVALKPDDAAGSYNLALALRDAKQFDEAMALFDRLVADYPENEEYQWDRAIAVLYQENYAAGWAAYEWRLKLARSTKRAFPQPRWAGEPLKGRTLFLHAEQGFGDMIQFARFIPRVAGNGLDGRVIVESAPLQLRLLASVPGSFEVVSSEEPPPPFDVYAPLLSLPGILGVGGDGLARDVPYLSAPGIHGLKLPPARPGKVRVGIVWAGKVTPRDRSAPLTSFLDLAAIQGTEWYSLQLGERRADLKRHAGGAVIHDLGEKLHDFADTAAVMDQLDLVITIDTAAAHLAGAMGKATWLMLTALGDWRWLDGRSDSPWYPAMRLFRQPTEGEWGPPFAEAARALEEFVGGRVAE